MKHPHRYDLPKGHIEAGEREIDCAFRELSEETGIRKELVEIESDFRFETIYYPRYKRYGNRKVEKSLVIFLARVDRPLDINCSEHFDYEWLAWHPPQKLNNKIIDSLLDSVAKFLRKSP